VVTIVCPIIDRLERSVDASANYSVRPTADRAEVQALVAGAAEELGIPVPPIYGDPPGVVAFPPHPERVHAALDKARADWRTLLAAPSGGIGPTP
jgi:hypothetical protein